MGLETGDLLWITCLADNIDSLSNSNVKRHGLQLIINHKQEFRVHGQSQIVDEIMLLSKKSALDVKQGCQEDDHP